MGMLEQAMKIVAKSENASKDYESCMTEISSCTKMLQKLDFCQQKLLQQARTCYNREKKLYKNATKGGFLLAKVATTYYNLLQQKKKLYKNATKTGFLLAKHATT